MYKRSLIVASMLMLLGSVATADIEYVEIQLIYEFGMSSSFDADGGFDGEGKQTLVSNNGGIAFLTDSTQVYFDNIESTLAFEGMTDFSVGGDARAQYTTGSWSTTLYDANSPVFIASGTVSWYNEDESDLFPDKVLGEGIVHYATEDLWLDEDFWDTYGEGTTWGSTNNYAGIETTISSIDDPPLLSYDNDWTASNVTLIVWADESIIIPEPATMALLVFGVLLLKRRRA
ncbi:MAG: PEP-CTERM sorting domain-containing protein [Phycisphaerales bacterium]|jgi:hypothetical protein